MSSNASNRTGTFVATGQSTTFQAAHGKFNMSLWGAFVATVQLERQIDGTNWLPCTNLGASVTFTAPCTEVIDEPETSVSYRLNCTSYTSGTVNYRLSQ